MLCQTALLITAREIIYATLKLLLNKELNTLHCDFSSVLLCIIYSDAHWWTQNLHIADMQSRFFAFYALAIFVLYNLINPVTSPTQPNFFFLWNLEWLIERLFSKFAFLFPRKKIAVMDTSEDVSIILFIKGFCTPLDREMSPIRQIKKYLWEFSHQTVFLFIIQMHK